ncbi:GDSL-type esterase/lipase family protein [Bradyrhizobium sp. Tv2a-2]|uniref:SGNH/GDSL hydrolase family protein n=1 Tax=Bradyrhizobium sp. Tv2a-2 TaxID=113395 RepID=UPI0003F6A0A8|nr:GDSL-type esterase/lipase family protein [Bradyrhizobium sp. Tv2a-2]
MRSGLTFGPALGLALLALVAGASVVRAEEVETCPVPASMLSTESRLSKVADAVNDGRALDILVIGSRSSSIGGSQDGAYPARLQAALKDKLPQLAVNISVELQPKQTAEETVSGFVKLLETKKPTLVIWQTGTVDAMRSVDPDDFHAAVDQGVTALQNAGADVILMNLQYSPRTETMISGSPYMDNIRAVAQEHDVPLFDRFSIMRQWNEQGDFDLFSAVHGPELARRVHDCIGRALSNFIFDAAHLGPAQQN